MQKARILFMMVRRQLLQFKGITLFSCICFANFIPVNLALAADNIVAKKQGSELITNKFHDHKEVTVKKAESTFEKQPQITAQTDPSVPNNSTPIDADKLRQDLLIQPLFKVVPKKRTYQPSLTFATPSAFGATWGDVFFGGSGATTGKARSQPDGSLSMGFGLGDARQIGLELGYNIGSIKNFGYNGTFDLKANHIVYAQGNTQIAAAAGWKSFAQHVKRETVRPSSGYGVVTTYSLLKPNDPVNQMPISFSLGAGGGDFRKDPATTGVFTGVGLQVHPQVGIGMGWSGVGFNIGASFVPIPTIPMIINAVGADLTDNSLGGTVFVLSIGYGFNFLPK